jgi:Cu(I)/Ag(I) efflux system membrane fusion protein
MNRSRLVAALLALAALGAAAYGGYRWGMDRGIRMEAQTSTSPPGGAASRRVLYWVDPMVPGPRFEKPGKSPFMDMALVPVYADEVEEAGVVAMSPRIEQNLGIRTAEALRKPMSRSLDVVGSVAFDERELELVQARANGFVERLYVRAPLDRVVRGAPLVQVLVPDWVAAQEDFLAARRMADAGASDLVDAARQRMRLAGMSDAQVRAVESSGKVQPRMTLVAPISGVVTELAAREGMTIMAGAPLFRINGLATVWVNAEVPESAAAAIEPGAAVTAMVAAFPGERFEGRIAAVLPEVSATTRTIRARIELFNRGGRLAPGMFVTLSLTRETRDGVLQVPSEAIIATGQRSLVMVAEPAKDGKARFRPVEVETGEEAGGMTEVRKGLDAGARVVVSGQFLIDSEASLKGLESRFDAGPSPVATTPATPQVHHGVGKVEKVNAESVTLSHGPIETMHWPAMTMEFLDPPAGLPANVRTGETVDFAFVQSDRGFVLRSIEPHAASGAARP